MNGGDARHTESTASPGGGMDAARDPQRRIELILASTSRFRCTLLERLRVAFTAEAPPFEEAPAPPGPVGPEVVHALVSANSRGKAASLRPGRPHAWILASDQLAECGGAVLTKPGSEARALEQLSLLSGREHHLHTAVTLEGPAGETWTEVVTSTLRIRQLSEPALRRYIALEGPLDAAGSYYSESLGIVLFEYLRGDDPTAIIGLPLVTTVRLLEKAGIFPLGTV